ncbi:MAG: polyprenyl synthetase family protein [Euryarchaeota archaeon]|nr:polyprenyl synthetase family protein [Euryarchaeota archaeon]
MKGIVAASELALVERELHRRVGSEEGLLREMCLRVVRAGGKRLRPILALLAYRAVGGRDITHLVPLAAAYELVHSATLIHDDINDGSPLRRGQPTLNQLYGDAQAIVAGDFLFVKGYEVCGKYGEDIIRITADACTQLAEGQILEFRNLRNLQMPEKTYYRIIELKTAAPLAAGARAGALLGKGTPAQVEALADYGLNLGMAFQVTDDLLDVVGDRETLGKPVGVDVVHGVLTLLSLYGLRHAPPSQRAELRRILRRETKTPEEVRRALVILRSSGAPEYAREAAHRYAQRARDAARRAPLQNAERLERLVDHVTRRER